MIENDMLVKCWQFVLDFVFNCAHHFLLSILHQLGTNNGWQLIGIDDRFVARRLGDPRVPSGQLRVLGRIDREQCVDRGDRGNTAQICQSDTVSNDVIVDQGIVQQFVRLIQVVNLALG